MALVRRPTNRRFNVFFDGKSGRVRTTASLTERQSMPFGRGDRRDWCAR
jgi:hypothetical protein